MNAPACPYRFFLGGADLEMRTIATLVRDTLGAAAVVDKALGWGAKVSDYSAELAALPSGVTPVLVELAADSPVPGAIVIDHHGPQAGTSRPTALEQVFALLALPPTVWTRHMALVAANDRGHIQALRAMGASAEEIRDIRAADRAAQGITAAEDEAAAAALAAARPALAGRVLLVHLPHGRTATVTDRLAQDDRPTPNLLIVSPAEINFFGPGPAVAALDAAFGGWSGGDLPHAGFWGHGHPQPALNDVLTVLDQTLAPASA